MVACSRDRHRRVDRFTLRGQYIDSLGISDPTSTDPATCDAPSAVAVDPRRGAIYFSDSGNVTFRGNCGRPRQPRPDPCRSRRVMKFAGD